MEKGIFGYIYRYSKPQQIILLIMILVSFPFLYISMDLPKTIINKAIGGGDGTYSMFGFEMDQLTYLWILCSIFLSMVCINGLFKYYVNVYRGGLGERMLRRLRFQLIKRVMRFPLPHFRKLSQGEIVSMVTTETEPLGGFVGDAFSLPAFQGGTLITVLAFIAIQDPMMGIAAMSLYPVQAYFIPKLQKKVNLLGKERVLHVRKVSERLGEMVTGVGDIRAHDYVNYELSDFSGRLGAINRIRLEIFRKKFFIKFLNNFLAQLTPFFFYSIGGYLVIAGSMSIGALVAVLAAYKELSAPWKELLNYYQRMEDSRIKYEQLVDQFKPGGLIDESLIDLPETVPEWIDGPISASNVSYEVEEGMATVAGAFFNVDVTSHTAISGPDSAGKSTVTDLIARNVWPTSGRLKIGDTFMDELPTAFYGRYFAYVDQEPFIRSGTLMDNLLLGLNHSPDTTEPPTDEALELLLESEKSGNSPYDINADWIDYGSSGVANRDELLKRAVDVLSDVGLDQDVYQIGLQRTFDTEQYPALVAGVLRARAAVREQLKSPDLKELVEVFDIDTFNANASVAENILFGAPVDDTFNVEALGGNAKITAVLKQCNLIGEFLDIGAAVAKLMVELFHDLPPGHDFFERFSFIDSEMIPEYQKILVRVGEIGLGGIEDAERNLLADLTFKLVPARHRLDMIDSVMQEKILLARRLFIDSMDEEMSSHIEFFHAEKYISSSNILNNILFGKAAFNKAGGAERINELLSDVIDDLDLRTQITAVGLDSEVGISGKRLSMAQRQKLALARGLIKRPQLLIVDKALSSLDKHSQQQIFRQIKTVMAGRGLVWVEDEIENPALYDTVLTVDQGKVSGGEDVSKAAAAPAETATASQSEAEVPSDAQAALNRDAQLLAGIPFFAGMDRSRLKLLAFASDELHLNAGETLFWQGAKGETAYVVLSGEMNVNVDGASGNRTVATFGRGELFGELALLCDVPRTATLVAKSETTLLSMSKDNFMKLVEENPEVSLNLTRVIAGRFEATIRNTQHGAPLYDNVTGLPKKGVFMDRLKHTITQDKRSGNHSALAVINLAELKALHDSGGEQSGKDALLEISERLKDVLRDTDTVARLDRDFAFGIIAFGANGEVDIDVLKHRLSRSLESPIKAGGQNITLEKGLNFEIYQLDDENIGKTAEILDEEG